MELTSAIFKSDHKSDHDQIEHENDNIISSYSLTDFQRHFRLSKSCFEIVLNELGNVIINQEKGRPPVPYHRKLPVIAKSENICD
jgi:hypothetical protein